MMQLSTFRPSFFTSLTYYYDLMPP